MRRRRLERWVGAYRDGALSERQAEAMLRRLETDPEAQLELERQELVGRLAREAWRDSPASPSPELLIAALRPGMARIDAEQKASRIHRWPAWLAPASVVALGTAAVLLSIALVQFQTVQSPAAPSIPLTDSRADVTAITSPPGTALASRESASEIAAVSETPAATEIPVYDLAQGESPLMLFEDGGTTFIWLIEPEKLRDDMSSLPGGWA